MGQELRNPNMNILLIAIILSLGIFGGIGAGIASYGGYWIVAAVIGAVILIGTLTVLIMLLIFGSWKKR